MFDGPGYVVSLSDPYERKAEIAKWHGDTWWPELWRLDVRLAKIDPNYTLVQFKEKFGRPTFYFQTTSGRRQEMQEIVDRAVGKMIEAEKRAKQQKEFFDRYAVPPTFDRSFEL